MERQIGPARLVVCRSQGPTIRPQPVCPRHTSQAGCPGADSGRRVGGRWPRLSGTRIWSSVHHSRGRGGQRALLLADIGPRVQPGIEATASGRREEKGDGDEADHAVDLFTGMGAQRQALKRRAEHSSTMTRRRREYPASALRAAPSREESSGHREGSRSRPPRSSAPGRNVDATTRRVIERLSVLSPWM